MSDSRTTSAASRTQQDDQNAMDAAVARAKAHLAADEPFNGEAETPCLDKEPAMLDKLIPALVAAQGAFTPIIKDRENPHFKSRYATLDAIHTATRSALQENGLAVMQITVPKKGGEVILRTILMHASGQTIVSDLPLMKLTAGPQQFGSELTYMRRYAYAALLSVTADEDDDGNAGQASAPRNAPSRTQASRPAAAVPTNAKPPSMAAIDPKFISWADSTCKLFAGVKTRAEREALALQIQENLDVLSVQAPELAKRVREAAQAAIERLQPQQQPKPAQAAQQAPQPADETFEAWPCDDIGEPVGEEPITTPQAFAEWFEAAAERTANIEALRENNMDAIGEAGREPAAARMISEAIAAAVKRLAKRDSERGDLREETEALDAMTDDEPSLIMPIPMTPGGKFNGPKYVKDAGAEIAKLDSLGAIDGWEAANLPSYAASPATKLGVDKALDARRVELGGEPAPVVDKLLEQDERLADDMLEELRPMKTPAEGDRWKARMTNQTIMARWKNDPTRHRLFHLVNDAFQKLYQERQA